MSKLKKHWHQIALVLILLLTGFLSLYGIWDEGYGNEFYATCIKSMLQSAKNFFFVSFDPGGWVTVDKPPVALWIQAIFAAVLGFHGWVLILPEALAAVGSVAILYHIVERHFGKAAGLISALVLSLSPVYIAVSKTNNMDSILILFMMLATWALTVAADKGKLRYLILCAVLLGVAYNTKTLQAFLILPALWAVYFFAANLKWRKRICHLLVATLVLAVVSLSWSVIVDLTPASDRPYVDSSTTNSELELAIGYNGLQRIFGMNRGGKVPSGSTITASAQTGDLVQSPINEQSGDGQAPNGQMPGGQSGNNANGQMPTGGGMQNGGQAPSGAMGGIGSNSKGATGFGSGTIGVFRMFNDSLGGQDSWLLPFGIMSILAIALRMRKKYGADKKRRNRLLGAAIFWGGSVVTIAAYFSVAGFFHQYYIATLAPFLAGLVGIGAVQMWKFYKEDGFESFLLPFSMLLTIIAQTVILSYYPAWAAVMIPFLMVFGGIPTVILFASKLAHKNLRSKAAVMIFSIGFAGLLIAPAVWSYTPILFGSNTSIPYAGPELAKSARGGFGGGSGMQKFSDSKSSASSSKKSRKTGFGNGGETSSSTKLIRFLLKNNTGEKFLVAVPDSQSAESIILTTGKAVMSVGGFSGSDKTLTIARLKTLIKEGQIKYFLVGGMKGFSSDEVTTWVKAHGKAVSKSLWSDTASSTQETSSAKSSKISDSSKHSGFGRQNSEELYDLSSCK